MGNKVCILANIMFTSHDDKNVLCTNFFRKERKFRDYLHGLIHNLQIDQNTGFAFVCRCMDLVDPRLKNNSGISKIQLKNHFLIKEISIEIIFSKKDKHFGNDPKYDANWAISKLTDTNSKQIHDIKHDTGFAIPCAPPMHDNHPNYHIYQPPIETYNPCDFEKNLNNSQQYQSPYAMDGKGNQYPGLRNNNKTFPTKDSEIRTPYSTE